jgi:hypothetical protein
MDRRRGRAWLVSVSAAGLVAGLLAFGGVAGAAPALAAGPPESHGAVQPAPVTAIPVEAQAQAVVPSLMENWNTSSSGGALCLGVTAGESNAPAVQWNCAPGHPDQEWSVGVEYGSTGFYQIQNELTSPEDPEGQCLGVAGGVISEGAQVVGWDCDAGHPDQYWAPVAICDDGLFEAYENLAAAQDGEEYVVGVAGNSNAFGAAVVLWQYQGVCNNQFWTLPG